MKPEEKNNNDLDHLGVKLQSDRSSLNHDYLRHYDKWLSEFRSSEITIVEIGGRNPISSKMWLQYFPNAKIVIIDTHLHKEITPHPRLELRKIQAFEESEIIDTCRGISPHFILDDGSHRLRDQIQTFQALFPFLLPGGAYIIEDLHTSFGSHKDKYGWESQTAFEWLSDLSEALNSQEVIPKSADLFSEYVVSSIDEITFIKRAVKIRKKENSKKSFHRTSILNSDSAEAITSIKTDPYRRINGRIIGAPAAIERKFDELQKTAHVDFGPVNSARLKDAIVVAGGIVLGEQSEVFSETLNCYENVPENHFFWNFSKGAIWAPRRPIEPTDISSVPGKQYVLLKSAWDKNYGHWLYDTLPKISVINELLDGKEPIYIVNPQNRAMKAIVRESLALAGVAVESIVEHDGQPRRYESLIVPGGLTKHPTVKAPQATKFIENLISVIPEGEHQRIYLSRNRYSRRRLSNEDQLWPHFEKLGFVKVFPEELNFREQVSLFKGAEYVAGNMGAAFSSLAYSPVGVKVLMLATTGMAHDFFYDIVCHKAGSYIALQGSVDVNSGADLSSDFSIEPHLVTDALELLFK